jgi:hypothetical protein
VTHLVILDNEAVGALASPDHPKHRRTIAHAQVVATRKRRAVGVSLVVPTSVRVEAGLDRTEPDAAFFGSLRVGDIPLDATAANVAASRRAELGVSVADAHIGAVIAAADTDRITVLTSDPGDVRSVATGTAVTIVRL